MSTNWLKIASGSTDGGDLYAQSGPGTAFSIGGIGPGTGGGGGGWNGFILAPLYSV